MKHLLTYIFERRNDILSDIKGLEYNNNPKPTKPVDIDKVKRFLITKYNAKNWEDFVDNCLKIGDCKKIAKSVYCKFKDMFDGVLEIEIDYNKNTCKQLRDKGHKYFSVEPESEWCGNHFVVFRDNIIYDFAKGSHVENKMYVLDEPNSESKYEILWSDKEYDKIRKDKIYFRKWW